MKEFKKIKKRKPIRIKPPEAFINGQKVRLKDIWDTPISQIKRLVIEFY